MIKRLVSQKKRNELKNSGNKTIRTSAINKIVSAANLTIPETKALFN